MERERKEGIFKCTKKKKLGKEINENDKQNAGNKRKQQKENKKENERK